ncbi:hypothetical protein [Microcoleus sp. FACHB-831]|uniref:hypothetical protein n=1 Tax=Microcoleus sp. FACHB-831 TaxID=2692827 RepID=UPI0016831738|nr:hypothetical protein [Microcoleus sp. FACHB-831]
MRPNRIGKRLKMQQVLLGFGRNTNAPQLLDMSVVLVHRTHLHLNAHNRSLDVDS